MAVAGRGILNKVLASSEVLVSSRACYSKKAVPVISSLGKAKKKFGKLGPAIEKKVLPVETNPEKLVNYVCGSNINKVGEDIKLMPDSEYPSWLWELRTGKPPPLEELNPEEMYYWKRVRKMALRQNNVLAKLKKF